MPIPGSASAPPHPWAASRANAGWRGGALRSPASTAGSPAATTRTASAARAISMPTTSGWRALWQWVQPTVTAAPSTVLSRATTSRRGSGM